VVLSGSFPLSAFGTFSASLKLDRSAAVGSYSLVATLGDATDAGVFGAFTVAEYRKPAFELTVTPARPDLVSGDPLEMAISAQYFSGGAVANAPVRWRLLAQPLFFSSEQAPNFSFQDLDDPYAYYHWDESADNTPGGRLIAEGTATTDAQGRLTLSPALNLDGAPGSQKLTLDVEVSDLDGQVIAGQGAAKLHAGDFYAGLRPEGYVGEVGKPHKVSLVTLTPQDQPRPNQQLEVAIYRHEWFSVQEQGSDGRLYWTSRFTDTLVETLPATTDAQGRASIEFTPADGGAYRIQAGGRDGGGREVKGSAFAWVYGGDVFWGINATNRIDLIADKSGYRPGETASILVPAPYEGMTALVTIERGRVIEHRVLTLAGSSELLPIEITADYAPNIYVSIVLIKPGGADLPVPDIRMGMINLPISIEQQELKVTITPDKQQAAPRDQITYTIEATDYQGRGVEGEIGLALVDKAVLALADDANPSLRRSFYEKRPLGVFTSSSLTALVDRVALRGQAGSKGGGGGAAAETLVRQNLPDTAYWNPAVVTGPDGKAQVTLTLPDNLTTWRLTARGLTADTRVGEASGDLVASLPLLIRPSLPRFLTVGDQVTLQAVVQNTTAGPIEATVNLNPGVLVLDGPAEQQVSVAANDRAVVTWSARAEKDGWATLLFSVSGGGLRDAVEQQLPIQRFVTPEVVASGGQVAGGPVVETLAIPAGSLPAGPPQGEVTLELVPSLGAGIQSGLDYLRSYGYDCTEQTVSRFLPNAVTYRLYKQLGIENADLKAGLEANLSSDLQRLYSLQHLDGGWGWWPGDKSNPYLSAYAMQGLVEVRRAGYSVDEQAFAAGLDYLKAALAGKALEGKSEPWRLNARAYVLFVLAEAGDPDQGRTLALYEQRANLQIYGRAYLLMTLQTLQPGTPPITTLRADLMGSALLSPTAAHWEERSQDRWTMSSDTRTTALALQALVRTDPANFLVPNAVRHLMGLRNHGHWQTTQESAVTLIALSEYIAQSGELEADYRYRVSLDDRLLGDGTVNRENLDDPITLVADLAQLNLEQGSQLRIERQDQSDGRGRLYYTLRMRYYQDAADVKPLDQGLS
ncbi:MAG TPA: alpha-2-macroglobulin family protein, partial [Herpetosiphonaceae bacterium]|nr:alpha-2-macroglobulin family protein [Herpetosiphonaceae bacterium]